MNFTVWAPAAKQVELVIGQETTPMLRAAGGWWGHTREAEQGTLYQFRIDGGAPLPDPRSKWQPEGVHGPSCMIDMTDLRPQDRAIFRARPLSEAIIYEMHIGTFTPEGTYGGAQSKLDYLLELGITHVELMPLASFPGSRGWSYDGVHLFAPYPGYGTPGELANFVEACHVRGIAVILDVVYNHLGPDGNYLPCFGPYFAKGVSTPWGEGLNCDGEESDEVRAFVIDNALMWLRDYGFDGLRLDAIHAIVDSRAVHLLEELGTRVRELGIEEQRPLILIAESNLNDPRVVRPVAAGGLGLDAHWADELHHAIHVFLTGEREGYYADFGGLADVAATLREGYLFQGQFSPSRKRSHGRPPVGVTPDQLIVCSQNHDQIGNRAHGERLSQLLSAEKLKAAATLVLLSPYVPLLFQGEEWAARTPFLFFSDHQAEELRRIIREARCEEFAAFGWGEDVPDPSEEETFLRSRLNWQEIEEPDQQNMLDWYRHLIRLRRERPAGNLVLQVEIGEDKNWLRMQCGTLMAVINFADAHQILPLPPADWTTVLSSHGGALGRPATFAPHETRVYRQ